MSIIKSFNPWDISESFHHSPYQKPVQKHYNAINLLTSDGEPVTITGDQIKQMLCLLEAIEQLDNEDTLKSLIELAKIMKIIKGSKDETKSNR